MLNGCLNSFFCNRKKKPNKFSVSVKPHVIDDKCKSVTYTTLLLCDLILSIIDVTKRLSLDRLNEYRTNTQFVIL